MTIGSVKAVPKPSSTAVDDALSLLTAFGKEGNENKALLEEMKAVQVHNEDIYRQVHAAIQENSALAAEAKSIREENVRSTAEADELLSKTAEELKRDRDSLDTRLSLFTEREDQFSIETANIEGSLSQREQRLSTAETAVEAKRLAAAKRSSEAEDILSVYQERLQEIRSIKSKLAHILSKIS